MKRNQGAVLSLVVVALMMVGIVLFVLTEGANTMLFRADTACVQAVERNLIASGLAWAREKAAGDAGARVTEPVDLNTTAFNAPDARLVVQIVEVQREAAKVRIETSCRKGRRTLHSSRTFRVATRAPAPG
jgi:hypothetical protein